ncbi:MAG TPA: helix-turn-helix domain-containing protein, partial [Candidatus Paceibacterota bacterium]|nr:helix-turn-helix domain-containing protein [Candidatus Paceibacterota bacterium]
MSKIIDKKIEDSILDDLYELGLDGKEARIYLSLIRLGEVGATRICTDTVLHRQFVYQSLYGLEKRGLIQVATIKGRKKFSAKNPKILSNLLAEKNRVADRVIDN